MQSGRGTTAEISALVRSCPIVDARPSDGRGPNRARADVQAGAGSSTPGRPGRVPRAGRSITSDSPRQGASRFPGPGGAPSLREFLATAATSSPLAGVIAAACTGKATARAQSEHPPEFTPFAPWPGRVSVACPELPVSDPARAVSPFLHLRLFPDDASLTTPCGKRDSDFFRRAAGGPPFCSSSPAAMAGGDPQAFSLPDHAAAIGREVERPSTRSRSLRPKCKRVSDAERSLPPPSRRRPGPRCRGRPPFTSLFVSIIPRTSPGTAPRVIRPTRLRGGREIQVGAILAEPSRVHVAGSSLPAPAGAVTVRNPSRLHAGTAKMVCLESSSG